MVEPENIYDKILLAMKNKSRLPGLFKKVELEDPIEITKKIIYRPK